MEYALFKNEFVRNRDTAREIFGYWFFRRPVMICVYLLLGVYTLSILLGLIFDFEDAKEFLVPFLMLIFAGVLMLISYRSQVKVMVQRDEELAKGRELLCDISVSDTEIIHSALGNEQSVGFENVSYAFITKSYVVVVTKAKIMYILKKDSFIIGDADGFVAFLRGKGVKIKK